MTGDLALHATPRDGREGYVLQISRPDAQGRVRWREWPSTDYVSAPREGISTVDEVVARVEEWARAGWQLSESVHLVTRWLRG
jgi:hypothetical protein